MVETTGEMSMDKYLFRVVQKAVIKNGEKFLVIKRQSNTNIFPEHWDFPGGKLEHGEESKESLKREVKEEAALDIEVLKPEFAFTFYVKNHYTIAIVFQCNLISGDVKLSSEHTEFKWATKEEILKLKCEPFLQAYLEGDDK